MNGDTLKWMVCHGKFLMDDFGVPLFQETSKGLKKLGDPKACPITIRTIITYNAYTLQDGPPLDVLVGLYTMK